MEAIFLTCFVTLRFEQEELFYGFAIWVLFGRPLINVLRKKQGKGQPIRDDGPTTTLKKQALLQWVVC